LGYLGIALIVGGICLVSVPLDRSLSSFRSVNLRSIFRSGAVNWAFACAIFISIFSVSDKVVVAATPPPVYIWWVIAGDTILWFPIVWRRLPLRRNFAELRTNWGGVIATGIAMTAAYGAALAALALTSASYVVAGRGLSVVIGAAVGAMMLKEGFGSARIIGALLMVTGLMLIAFS
jgi:drug/metabolite transporter (DMT)-like permease